MFKNDLSQWSFKTNSRRLKCSLFELNTYYYYTRRSVELINYFCIVFPMSLRGGFILDSISCNNVRHYWFETKKRNRGKNVSSLKLIKIENDCRRVTKVNIWLPFVLFSLSLLIARWNPAEASGILKLRHRAGRRDKCATLNIYIYMCVT